MPGTATMPVSIVHSLQKGPLLHSQEVPHSSSAENKQSIPKTHYFSIFYYQLRLMHDYNQSSPSWSFHRLWLKCEINLELASIVSLQQWNTLSFENCGLVRIRITMRVRFTWSQATDPITSDVNSWQILKVCLCSAADFPREAWNDLVNFEA